MFLQSYCDDPDLVLELKNLIVIFADTLQVGLELHPSHPQRTVTIKCLTHKDSLCLFCVAVVLQGYGFLVSRLFDLLFEVRDQYNETLLKKWSLVFRSALVILTSVIGSACVLLFCGFHVHSKYLKTAENHCFLMPLIHLSPLLHCFLLYHLSPMVSRVYYILVDS